jgi:nitroreductase
MSPELERILTAGNSAPSGENCQPWHFRVAGDTVELHLLPERDPSAYGWGQRASYLAHGAVIENIVIAASAENMRAMVTYLPDASRPYLTGIIRFVRDARVTADPLAAAIPSRMANRKSYARVPLSELDRQALKDAAEGESEIAFALCEDSGDMRLLGRIGSTNEEIMLANPALHDFFFSHVNWTKEEDERKKVGFYIKTLELPPPAVLVFKLLAKPVLGRFLNRIGMNRVVARQNAATNAAASAIGAFALAKTDPLDFILAGRAIERVWLTATARGLAFQPLAGIPFFKLRIDAGEPEPLVPAECARVLTVAAEAGRILGTGDQHLAFMFRVGHAPLPSAHAVRFPLSAVVTIA